MPQRQIKNLVLIGPAGSGKTTVGRHLAKILSWDFVDCDHEIERRTGVAIDYIFSLEGESGFRMRETRALAELLRFDRKVIATGGGTILEKANRDLIRETSLSIYLAVSLQTQLYRLGRNNKRPLLQNGDLRENVMRLNATRIPFCEELSDFTVSTTSGNYPAKCARNIHKFLSENHPDLLSIS